MARRPRIHAVVTARGGSRGIPRKNLRELAGVPLLAYSIAAGRDCPLVDRCFLSTEDDEIAAVGRAWGAEVIPRPPELATDDAGSVEVMVHALEWMAAAGDPPDHAVLLQPTSPLRTAGHLEECLRRYLDASAASALSVTDSEHHPYKQLRVVADGDGERLEPLFGAAELHRPRQLLPRVVRQNGAIYVVERRAFLERRSFFLEPALPFPMSPEESVDVDVELDLRLAALLLEDRERPRPAAAEARR